MQLLVNIISIFSIVSFCTFIFSIFTFFLAGNIFVYTPSQGTKKGKELALIKIKMELPTLAENKHLFDPSLPS